ncbi:MAG: sugar nucleotide-binding protein, partial [Candidatus Binatia bacterium]
MKILITGAAGLVGSHLARRLADHHEVLGLKHADLDITDAAAVRNCVGDAKPALIANCAVIQVEEAEKDPAKAQAVNADGPRYLAEAARNVGAEIIHFSTQYAFA